MMFSIKRFVDRMIGAPRGIEQYSYIPILMEALKDNPKNILEWGTGLSTSLMSLMCPNASIVAIEHNYKWFLYYNYKFRNNANVSVVYVPNIKNYSNYPLGLRGCFDLVFVDGMDRNKCLVVANAKLVVGGRIILHDVDRKEYLKGVGLFTVVRKCFNTVLLKSLVVK